MALRALAGRKPVSDEVIVDWIDGAKLAARNGMTGAAGNIHCGLHEFEGMAFVLHLLRPGDVFVDVGANVGSYTILTSRVCGTTGIAFEPAPETRRALRRNLQVNGVEDQVTAAEMALGDCEGEVGFTIGQDTTNRIAPADGRPSRTVRLGTLDGVLADTPPTMRKIDVEGFEATVLAGGAQTLARPSLCAVQVEGHDAAVADCLGAEGFERCRHDPFDRSLPPCETDMTRGRTRFM